MTLNTTKLNQASHRNCYIYIRLFIIHSKLIIYILVNGGWTSFTVWSKWTTCSESCGNGIQKSTRSKSCTNPEPKFAGKLCIGGAAEERTQPCKLKDCPGKIHRSQD